MPRLFYGNFDFEETLARRPRQQRSRSLQRLMAELSVLWLAVAEDGDVIWSFLPIGEVVPADPSAAGLADVQFVSQRTRLPPGLDFVPWGWTAEALDFAQRCGAVSGAPPLKVVRAVNSRAFSCQLERTMAADRMRTAEVSDTHEMLQAVDAVADQPLGFVIKAEFGNSSRQRFRHRGGPVDLGRLRQWAARRFATGQQLYVESWLDRVDEVGIQIEILCGGEPHLVGVTGHVTSRAGEHRGVDFTPGREQDPLWSTAIAAALQAANLAQAHGYWGPFGVDAMCYRDTGGQQHVRTCQDINARWTMGRLSLGLRRLLRDGERGRWAQRRDAREPESGIERRVLSTSPTMVAGHAPQLDYVVAIQRSR